MTIPTYIISKMAYFMKICRHVAAAVMHISHCIEANPIDAEL